MLSLPCFPSTDGPVHMYYVHILGSLLSGHDQTFAPFFRIRHLLPPYALYYYGLLLLSRIMPMLLADRVLICIYLVSFVCGFRYLARAIGPSADRMTLLATLLLLNWPLGMGFVNFCLALSLCFWAAGLWLRIMGTRNLRGRVIFLLLVTAIMFTHPVPLLLVLGVAAILLLVHWVHFARRNRDLTFPPHGRADLLTLALASLNVGYVKLFANANPLRQSRDVIPSSLAAQILGRARDYYGHQHSLAFLLGHRPDLAIYHAALVLTVVVPALLATRQWFRNRRGEGWNDRRHLPPDRDRQSDHLAADAVATEWVLLLRGPFGSLRLARVFVCGMWVQHLERRTSTHSVMGLDRLCSHRKRLIAQCLRTTRSSRGAADRRARARIHRPTRSGRPAL